MKWSLVFPAVVFCSSLTTPARAATLELGGILSYDDVDAFGSQDDLTGPSFTGVLTSSVYNVSSGAALKLGANIGHQRISNDDNGVEMTFSNTFVGGLVGFDVAFSPRFKVQTTAGYDIGLFGEAEIEATSGLKVSRDTDEFRRIHYGFTGLFRVIPSLDAGVGVRWNQGYYELEDTNGEPDFRGFQLLATVMVPVI